MVGRERASHELSIDTKNAQNGGLAFFGRDCDLPGVQIAISRDENHVLTTGQISAEHMQSLKVWRANGRFQGLTGQAQGW